jgi:hypothetical protein
MVENCMRTTQEAFTPGPPSKTLLRRYGWTYGPFHIRLAGYPAHGSLVGTWKPLVHMNLRISGYPTFVVHMEACRAHGSLPGPFHTLGSFELAHGSLFSPSPTNYEVLI